MLNQPFWVLAGIGAILVVLLWQGARVIRIARALAILDGADEGRKPGAVDTLANLGSVATVGRLLDGKRVPDRWWASRALERIVERRGTRVLRPLVRALSSSDEITRVTAAESLGKILDEPATRALTDALPGEKSEFVRNAIEKALGLPLTRNPPAGRISPVDFHRSDGPASPDGRG